MRRIREVLRLKHELGRSHREIARSLGISNSTASDYARRAMAAGLSWPLPDGMDDGALEAALFGASRRTGRRLPEPDWGRVHRELQRHKGVTKQPLWVEYRRDHPEGYGYNRFCELYRKWRGRLDVSMRQVHRAGEKAFVDYAGPKFEVVDGETGEAIGPLLAEPNERPFSKADGSRRSWFEDLDRPALKPLPAERYEYAEWRRAVVNIDYHIQVRHAFYSVPHVLARTLTSRHIVLRLPGVPGRLRWRHSQRTAGPVGGTGDLSAIGRGARIDAWPTLYGGDVPCRQPKILRSFAEAHAVPSLGRRRSFTAGVRRTEI